MTVNKTLMSQLHEKFAAEVIDGTRSKASGAVWTHPADGRASRMTHEFGWANECKATLGKEITLTRLIVEKGIDQAGGERILFWLRWYEDESLQRVTYDLVSMEVENFRELLETITALHDENEALVIANAALKQTVDAAGPNGLHAELERAQSRIAELERQLAGAAQVQQGRPSFPSLPMNEAQADLMLLGMPPSDMWPCTVIDRRPRHPDPRMQLRGWYVDARGQAESLTVLSVRIDQSAGTERLMVNDQHVRSGILRVNGGVVFRAAGR